MVIKANVSGVLGKFKLDASFEAPGFGVTALFGRSGSGKTSVLRWMAGLEKSHQGQLTINGEVWQDSEQGIFVPAHHRKIGYIFQETSLFPHLSVRGNLEFGLKRRNDHRRTEDFDEVVELLGLIDFLNRGSDQLSGGERQRVAMARALLAGPEILLLDEPLAALDIQSKLEILPYLERLKTEAKVPILYISHSPEEVIRLCDHLIELKDGKVTRTGKPKELLSHYSLAGGTSLAMPTNLTHGVKAILQREGYLVEDLENGLIITKKEF